MWKTPEIPPSEEELKEIKEFNEGKPHPFIQVIGALIAVLSVSRIAGFRPRANLSLFI